MASKKRMLSGFVMCLVALMAFGCSSSPKDEMQMKSRDVAFVNDTYSVLIYQPTALFNEEGLRAGRYDEVLRQHALYMEDVNNLPKPVNLVLGGLMFEGQGAMYFFEGTYTGELWPISAKDPMVKSGLFKASVRQFTNHISTFGAEVDESPVYYVRYSAPGEKYDRSKSVYNQDWIEPHVNYLIGVAGQGDIAMAGPFTDAAGGGMSIFRASDLNDLMKVSNDDPAEMESAYKNKYWAWMVSMR